MNDEKGPQRWWQSLHGILVAVTGFPTAIAGLVGVLHQVGWLGGDEPATMEARPQPGLPPASQSSQSSQSPGKAAPGGQPGVPSPLEQLADRVRDMPVETLKRYFGQVLVAGLDGNAFRLSDTGDFERAFNGLGTGGVILFERNFLEDPAASAAPARHVGVDGLLRTLRHLDHFGIEGVHIPRFVMLDHEGGNVSPLSQVGIATNLPAPMALAALRGKGAVRACARIASAELAALGINVNLAPVLDINIHDENNLIQDRSFGGDVEMVGELARVFMDASRDQGVITVLKHFPGHGGTESGFMTPGLPRSHYTHATLKNALKPFRKLVDAGAGMVMTSHFALDALGVRNVTTDGRIVTSLLAGGALSLGGGHRIEGLGYKGLVITDNLLEPSLTASKKVCEPNVEAYLDQVKQAALDAFDAGHDLLMFAHVYDTETSNRQEWVKVRDGGDEGRECYRWAITLAEFQQIHEFLQRNIFAAANEETRARRIAHLRQSIEKVLRLKAGLGASRIARDASAFHEAVLAGRHKQCADELFRRSFTLINPENYVPLHHAGRQDTVMVFMPSRFATYQGLEAVRKAPDYQARLRKNVEDFDFSRALDRAFRHRTRLVFELEKQFPRDDEFDERAARILQLLKEAKAEYVVFLVNKSSRWRLVQQVLKRLDAMPEPVLDPRRVTVIVTDHATLLKSGDAQGLMLAKQVGIVVAYSGYGYRAELLAAMLANGEIMASQGELPVIVDHINPSPDFELDDQEFRC